MDHKVSSAQIIWCAASAIAAGCLGGVWCAASAIAAGGSRCVRQCVRRTCSGPVPPSDGHPNTTSVMNAISDRDPYVEGSRNKHWWRQVEAGMCSAMQHKITIRTLKHRAKLLDARGVQRTSIEFFESSARGEAAYDGIKAAQRAQRMWQIYEHSNCRCWPRTLINWTAPCSGRDNITNIDPELPG